MCGRSSGPRRWLVFARPSALPPVLHVEREDTAQEVIDAAVKRLRDAGLRADGQLGPEAAGSTANEFLDIAGSYGATLIVVGDRGSRVSDVLLGSVPNRIVHLADCPVLLVR